MTDIFERVLLPVADPNDAASTCEALTAYDAGSVVALHVVEKAGGAPDKASVEQREEYAAEIFDIVEAVLGGETDLETEVAFGTDVADTIFERADAHDATAIVFTPRGGSRLIQLVTGDVTLDLVTETDRPVVVLPDVEAVDVDDIDVGATDEGGSADGDGTDGETDDRGDATGTETK